VVFGTLFDFRIENPAASPTAPFASARSERSVPALNEPFVLQSKP
jgi:hypothetical protein